jgi:uncharacterized alkaline shock family protein YloU
VADTAARGRTTIADRVLEQLATRYALDVPGVVSHSVGPDALSSVTPTLPRVSAGSDGDRVEVDLRIAVGWDRQAAEVARAVRGAVRDRLASATGKRVERVDVTVSAFVPGGGDRPSGPRRRVQ